MVFLGNRRNLLPNNYLYFNSNFPQIDGSTTETRRPFASLQQGSVSHGGIIDDITFGQQVEIAKNLSKAGPLYLQFFFQRFLIW